MKRFVSLGLLIGLGWSMGGAQQNMRFSLRPDQLAISNCLAQPGAVPIPLAATNLNLEVADWATAALPTKQPGEFLLVFAQPTGVGTIIVYETQTITYSSGGNWKALLAGDEAGRALQVIPFPKGELIDSIKISVASRPAGQDERGQALYRATLPFVTLIPTRIMRVSGEAKVTASSMQGGAGFDLGRPEVLLDGRVDEQRNFSTAVRDGPISGEMPEWILLSWKEPQVVRGLLFLRGKEEEGLGQRRIELYTGSGDPGQARDRNDWLELVGRSTVPGRFRFNEFFVLRAAVKGLGLRLTSTGGVKQVGLGEVVVLRSVDDPAVDRP